MEQRKFWDTNAESWTQAVRTQGIESRRVTGPAIIERILDRKPQTVLDLGCGEGWIGSVLTEKGIGYVGIDGSSVLISRAQRLLPSARLLNLSYEQLVGGDPLPEGLKKDRFDSIVFNFALFSDDVRPILSWAVGRLEIQGSLFIQTLHPCFTLQPYADGWRTEDFASFPITFQGQMRWYGRTLETWLTDLSHSGLTLKSMWEPKAQSAEKPVSLIIEAKIAARDL